MSGEVKATANLATSDPKINVPLFFQTLPCCASRRCSLSKRTMHVYTCASRPSPAQCSILGVSAGSGGRAEQWCYPFHPELQRGSEVEEIPATNQTLTHFKGRYNCP
ncbi:hypothetical protein EXN66_Car005993 [Channa argus]|uniref:Uncharacterized protein n=1 Tax=Channa argus TaxID=215402 RepID=A0A6G1PJ15_CHAAH|nr:hypothetical protein EXN66_Car005993 [Channa argus]KAK2915515.1 hypothetical protein Q8A73_006109 [Channa argus]